MDAIFGGQPAPPRNQDSASRGVRGGRPRCGARGSGGHLSTGIALRRRPRRDDSGQRSSCGAHLVLQGSAHSGTSQVREGMTQDFYDRLAPYYHLLYPNWEASSARQSRGLSEVLNEFDVEPGRAILDAACGIGTQALGLAQLGYNVTASDLSP